MSIASVNETSSGRNEISDTLYWTVSWKLPVPGHSQDDKITLIWSIKKWCLKNHVYASKEAQTLADKFWENFLWTLLVVRHLIIFKWSALQYRKPLCLPCVVSQLNSPSSLSVPCNGYHVWETLSWDQDLGEVLLVLFSTSPSSCTSVHNDRKVPGCPI